MQMEHPSHNPVQSVPKLSARQERAIGELLIQSTVRKAAKTSGVPEQTLRRWLRDDAIFIARYREARREAVDGAIKVLNVASGDCASVLSSIAKDQANPLASRVNAAKACLALSLRGYELFEITQRLESLEAGLDRSLSELPPAQENAR